MCEQFLPLGLHLVILTQLDLFQAIADLLTIEFHFHRWLLSLVDCVICGVHPINTLADALRINQLNMFHNFLF